MARKKKHAAGGGGGGGHDGAGSMRWLLTYSDMITLLMAFFIMMYSMSVVNLTKFAQVAFSIRSGFGGILTGSGLHIFASQAAKHSEASTLTSSDKALEHARQHILQALVRAGLTQKQVDVSQESRGLVISISTDNLLFALGSAQLSPGAVQVLDLVGDTLRTVPNAVMVEGHTDPRPIATTQFPSNWELSAARASRVVRYLLTQHIAPDRMAAVGYGETHPLFPNDTEAHRARNRRVDVVVLEDGTQEAPPEKPPVPQHTIHDEIHRSIHDQFNRVWSNLHTEGSPQ